MLLMKESATEIGSRLVSKDLARAARSSGGSASAFFNNSETFRDMSLYYRRPD